MTEQIVDVDLLKVYKKAGDKKELVTTLSWGDPIQVGKAAGATIPVTLRIRKQMPDGSIKPSQVDGFVSKDARFRDPAANDIVRYSIVDVQQGDGAVLETPKKTVMLVDSGENAMFARYLATRFPGTSGDKPLAVRAIVNTHTDADHLHGFVEVHKAEKQEKSYKRIFIHPERIFHNGLVKRENATNPRTAFGSTVEDQGKAFVIDLADDLTTLQPSQMNQPIQQWVKVLKDWSRRGPIEIRRLSDRVGNGGFAFLNQDCPGLEVEVLGPMEAQVNGQPALPLLHEPPKSIPGADDSEVSPQAMAARPYSVSHTVNGNSIVLMLKYGNIRLLLTGDLNEEAEAALVRRCKAGLISLDADFLKVPHHGSADFSREFLEKVRPVLSVVSCGDESAKAEYIHPRATLVGALGKYSRAIKPLVLVTELVAFLKTMGPAQLVDKNGKVKGTRFFSFKREAYGIVHLAFNKERMLVFTHSGKRDLKEAYAYCVAPNGQVTFDKVRQA